MNTNSNLLIFIVFLFSLLPGCCWYEKTDQSNNTDALIDSINTSTDIPHKQNKKETIARQIIIKNAINKEMLGYKKFGTHYPDAFRILINGKELEQGQEEKFTINDNKLVIRYEYRFGRHRDGAKLISFRLDPEQTHFTITFKWKDDWRILINNATPIDVKELH